MSATFAVAWWRSRPVTVALPVSASDPACARMAGRLPSRVRDADRVPTSVKSVSVAAWGRPPVIWRCGVPAPGRTTEQCLTVDGVDWIRTPLDDGSSFTTYGRTPAVQVLVPRGTEPEPLLLPDFTAAASLTPQGTRRCS
ncbi:MAG: DUF3515 family protein [Angustibacter sp.]